MCRHSLVDYQFLKKVAWTISFKMTRHPSFLPSYVGWSLSREIGSRAPPSLSCVRWGAWRRGWWTQSLGVIVKAGLLTGLGIGLGIGLWTGLWTGPWIGLWTGLWNGLWTGVGIGLWTGLWTEIWSRFGTEVVRGDDHFQVSAQIVTSGYRCFLVNKLTSS